MTRRVTRLAAAAAGAAALTAAPASAAQSVYLLQGEQVTAVTRSGTTVRSAVQALIAGPTAAERARGIRTQVPPRVPVNAVSVANGVATVDLGHPFAACARSERLNARLSQLVLTVDAVPGVRSVRLRIDGGTPFGLFPGVDLTRPVTSRSIRTPDLPPPDAGGTSPGTPVAPTTQALESAWRNSATSTRRGSTAPPTPRPRTR